MLMPNGYEHLCLSLMLKTYCLITPTRENKSNKYKSIILFLKDGLYTIEKCRTACKLLSQEKKPAAEHIALQSAVI